MTRSKSPRHERSAVVRFLPFDVRVEVAAGSTILDAALEARLPLKASCGGEGTCGDCIVKVLEGAYETSPSAALSPELAGEGYVLACLTRVTGDLTADLPHFEEIFVKSADPIAIGEDDKDRLSGAYEVAPMVTELQLDLPPPSLESNYGDLSCLSHHRLGDLWDAVAYVDHQRAPRGIQIALALCVVEIDTLATSDGRILVAQPAVKNATAHCSLHFRPRISRASSGLATGRPNSAAMRATRATSCSLVANSPRR